MNLILSDTCDHSLPEDVSTSETQRGDGNGRGQATAAEADWRQCIVVSCQRQASERRPKPSRLGATATGGTSSTHSLPSPFRPDLEVIVTDVASFDGSQASIDGPIMQPEISVVVPVFNVQEYITKCVTSILVQTYSDFELILIDDGSTDGSGALCDALALTDSRIVAVHQHNQGLSAARNAGLDLAIGSHVSFVDSDDWIHPECLRSLRELVDASQAEISMCAVTRLASEEEAAGMLAGDSLVQAGSEVVRDMVEGRREHLSDANIACAKLYDRRIFEGIRFPLGRLHEDEFTTYRLLLRAERVVHTTAELYMYRQRPGSITGANRSFESRLDAIDAFLERRQTLQSIGLQYNDRSERTQLFGMFMQANSAYLRMSGRQRADASGRLRATAGELARIPQSPITRLTYQMARVVPGASTMRAHRALIGLASLRGRDAAAGSSGGSRESTATPFEDRDRVPGDVEGQP